MAAGTGQPFVYACQGRVVEARGKATAGLMALLARVRRPRVVRTFADGSRRIAYHMTGYARLSLDRRVLVVDRIDFLEVASRGVTRVAVPAVRIHRRMHGINRMGLGEIDRVVIRGVVTRTATGRVSRMYGIHERSCRSKATPDRAIDARTVGCIRVTLAAIKRCGNVPRRLRDHLHAVMRFAVMAARAVARDACRSVVKGRQRETDVRSAMTYEAVLAHRRQRHVCQRLTGRRHSVMTGGAGRRRRIIDDSHAGRRMIERRV